MLPKEAKRPDLQQDMQNLKLVVETLKTLIGRILDAAEIKTELGQSVPKKLPQVNAGTIVLTGTKNSKVLWAYEAEADNSGASA